MTSTHTWPVSVTPLGDVVAGTLLWSDRNELRVVVVVKATFAIVPGGDMTPARAAPLVLDDEHHGDHPARSLRAAGELAPRRPLVDVWLTGHAHRAPGAPANAVIARLILGRDGKLLVNKAIRVQGDWSEASGEPGPFEHMPLVYERALGGPGSPDNPAGRGLSSGHAPNLLDPRGRPVPACFAPLPRRWPARAALLGDLDPAALEAPILALPEGFDWTYFQAAPADQRIDSLRGDEVMILDNLHPSIPRVEARLPSARGAARVYGPGPDLASGKPIELRADTLAIDVNQQICTILWRGHVATGGRDLRELSVVAGVELPGRPLAWPAEAPPRGAPAPAAIAEEEVSRRLAAVAAEPARRERFQAVGSTIRIGAADLAQQLAAAGLPFDRPPDPEEKPIAPTVELDPADVARQITAARAARERAAAPARVEKKIESTLELTAEEAAKQIAAARLPFEPAPAASPRRTQEIDPAAVARLSAAGALPFERAPAEPARVAPPAQKPAPPARSKDPFGSTLEITAEEAAKQTAAARLPFERRPEPRRGTEELDPAAIARLTAADVLPFERAPAPPGREEPPIPPAMMAPPPEVVIPPPEVVIPPPEVATPPPKMASAPSITSAPADEEPPPARRRRGREKRRAADLGDEFLVAVEETEKTPDDDPPRRR